VLVGRLAAAGQGGAAYAGFRVWGSVGYVVVTLITGLALNPRGLKLDRTILDHVFQIGPLLFFVIAIISFFVPDPHRLNADVPKTALPRLSLNLRWFLGAYFLYIFALYGASNFLALYMKERGGTSLWITAMFAGGVVCEILVMRLSGRFSDRFGRRPLLAVAFVLLPMRLALYGLMSQPLGIFAVQLLHGLNFGIMGALAIALINDLSEDEHRGKAQARLATVAALATSLAPLLFGWVAQELSLAVMFEVAAGFAAVAMLVFLLRVEESHPEAGSVTERIHPRFRRIGEILDAPPRRG
jgi:MFS family permease